MSAEDDPFSCFDDDADSAGDATSTDEQGEQGALLEDVQRDPNNGILAFHPGTEQALLNHVQQNLDKVRDRTDLDAATAVIGHIDDFCVRRHWMMHVGQEKGSIIKDFLRECVDSKAGQNLCVVEIGTYCGYSSVVLASELKRLGCVFQIWSIEVVESHAKVARQIISLAGLTDNIQVLSMNPYNETVGDLLKQNIKSDVIDFLFIDHDKSLYLADLQNLEICGLIKKGSFVAADNVIFAKIDDYRQHVSKLKEAGTVQTRLAMSWLEYSEPDRNTDEARTNLMKDGIGKTRTDPDVAIRIFLTFFWAFVAIP
jgi:catechol O-methyltransferase